MSIDFGGTDVDIMTAAQATVFTIIEHRGSQDKIQDGCGRGTMLCRPAKLCVEEQTTFMVDAGVLRRLETSCALADWLTSELNICIAFGVSGTKVKHTPPSLEHAIKKVSETNAFHSKCHEEVLARMGKDEFATDGPQGTLSNTTRGSLVQMEKELRRLKNEWTNLGADTATLNVDAFTTLSNERFNALMRAGSNACPSPYEYYGRFAKVVKEQIKRKLNCGYQYFTSNRRDCYPDDLGTVVDTSRIMKRPTERGTNGTHRQVCRNFETTSRGRTTEPHKLLSARPIAYTSQQRFHGGHGQTKTRFPTRSRVTRGHRHSTRTTPSLLLPETIPCFIFRPKTTPKYPPRCAPLAATRS